jgi:hypothetical protein
MSHNDVRARLIAYLTQAGLSTVRANANLDALLASASEPMTMNSPKTTIIQTPMQDSRARALAALVYREGGHLEITLDELLAASDSLTVTSTESGSITLRDPNAWQWDGQGVPTDATKK